MKKDVKRENSGCLANSSVLHLKSGILLNHEIDQELLSNSPSHPHALPRNQTSAYPYITQKKMARKFRATEITLNFKIHFE